jgi:hypothetical protein
MIANEREYPARPTLRPHKRSKKTKTPMFKRQKSPMHQLQLGTGTMNFFGVWNPGVWSFFADSEYLT